MRVALMADVENDLVLRGVEMSVQGDRKLRHAEIGGEVTAVCGDGADDLFAYFCGKRLQLLRGERANIIGRMD